MPADELDRLIVEILQSVNAPMTIPQIERRVADRNIEADTFDVQRAVRRLVETGRASLTPRLYVVMPSSK